MIGGAALFAAALWLWLFEPTAVPPWVFVALMGAGWILIAASRRYLWR